MKIKEIKEKVEKVIRTEYIAEDGTIFYIQEECEKYEQTALFTVARKLTKIATTDEYCLFNGCEDNEIEIFDIKDDNDLDNLKRYIYLTIQNNGAEHKDIEKYEIFDDITSGHEVIVLWSWDKDYCWTYGDGSLQGYYENVKAQYDRITNRDKK